MSAAPRRRVQKKRIGSSCFGGLAPVGVVPIYWLTVAATVAGAGAGAAGDFFFFPEKNPVIPVALEKALRSDRRRASPPEGSRVTLVTCQRGGNARARNF